MKIKSAIINGIAPLNIVSIGTSGATPFITKTFIPMGGVTTAVDVKTTITIPNHIGSYPNDEIMGTKIGAVSKIKAIASIKQPKKTKLSRLRAISSNQVMVDFQPNLTIQMVCASTQNSG